MVISTNLFEKKHQRKKHQKHHTATPKQLPHLNHVEAMENGKMTVEQHEERKGTPSFPACSVAPNLTKLQLDIWRKLWKNLEKHNEGTWRLSAA